MKNILTIGAVVMRLRFRGEPYGLVIGEVRGLKSFALGGILGELYTVGRETPTFFM